MAKVVACFLLPWQEQNLSIESFILGYFSFLPSVTALQQKTRGLWKSKTGYGVFGNAVTPSSLCRERQGCISRVECCVCTCPCVGTGQTLSTDDCGRGMCGDSGCCAWH